MLGFPAEGSSRYGLSPIVSSTLCTNAVVHRGAKCSIGAVRLAQLAASLEAGGSKEAATPGVLHDLLSACSELERMLLAGNLTETQGPHDHYDSSRNA